MPYVKLKNGSWNDIRGAFCRRCEVTLGDRGLEHYVILHSNGKEAVRLRNCSNCLGTTRELIPFSELFGL